MTVCIVQVLPGTQVSDSLGNVGSGSSIDILGWELSGIKARLPDGVREKFEIWKSSLKATVSRKPRRQSFGVSLSVYLPSLFASASYSQANTEEKQLLEIDQAGLPEIPMLQKKG